MRLKSIEMQGFKSFADKIYLDFNPGITAIVGPNGSGKSNISDAIRWVMGEQSAKSLRGSKMEDVIFSGTEERKPLGFAEVTLVLDNSDHYFALDFPEITVTRRVYRSGEGEYYINKTLCRLKDIHELFMDTGLGRDGYSIIGQGKIDNILSTKSEDRRQIFEEAAGISKYKYRKIEAERKLTQATENLTRVEDILGELESRLEPLRVQSEKAKKYLLLRDEMRGLDIAVSVIHAEKAKAELKELNQNIEILASQIKDVQGEMEATEAEITAMYDNMKDFDQEIIACREAEQGAISSIHEEKNQITIHQNDIEHNEQNIARLEEEVKTGMAAIAEIDKVIAEHSEVLAKLDAKNQGTCETLESLTEKSLQAGRDANAKNDAMENIKAELIDLLAKINTLRADCNSLDMLVVNFKERQAVLEKDLNDKVESRTELEKGQKDATQAAAACETEIKQEEEALKQAENDIFLAEQKIRKMQETQNQNMLLVDQKRSRKKMLLDMEREYEGYARGVKCVMTAVDEGKLSKAKIYGPLSKLIRTEKKYIAAIETALGAANQNIVTAREEDAKTAINYLKNSKQGRATFLPISAIKSKTFDLGNAEKQAGFLSIASDLVDCDKIYQNIISNLLGGTVVCDTMDNAVEMAKKNNHKFRIVTLDGDVIQPGGAMTGGSRNKNTSSLFRTGEIESLEKEIDALNKTLEQEAKEQETLTAELEEKKLEFKEKTGRMQEKRTHLVQLQAEEKRFQDLLQGVSQSAEQAEKEHTDILARIAGLEKDKETKNLEIDAKTEICTRLEVQIASAQKEYSDLSSQNELLISQLTELNLARNTILKDMELEQDRISRLNTEKAQHLEGITTKNGGMQMLRNRNQDAADAIAESNKRVAMLEQSLEDARKRLEELSQSRAQTELRVREQQDSMKDVQEQVFSLTQQQNKMEVKAEKFETEIESIVNRLLEEYELPYSEAASMKRDEDFDFKNASQRIRELRDKIRGLGNINIDAIEEYKNIKERFEFLSAQASDLQKAKGELEAVIEEMLSIMQARFAEQFRVINTNFNRVFAELFGGGRANLTLTEPDNILESGIEIEAQPPGKKLQSLTLLSGGERAFTAIALLFAILDVRPTPFCILDEIEAALDDVNVYRTAQYLKNYSDKTQFIVVTHRRGTMEAANILYGVTMQERGISKLLSLNIDEIQE